MAQGRSTKIISMIEWSRLSMKNSRPPMQMEVNFYNLVVLPRHGHRCKDTASFFCTQGHPFSLGPAFLNTATVRATILGHLGHQGTAAKLWTLLLLVRYLRGWGLNDHFKVAFNLTSLLPRPPAELSQDKTRVEALGLGGFNHL